MEGIDTARTVHLVLATRRSGHHAVLNWMCLNASLEGRVVHYNSVDYPGFGSFPAKAHDVAVYEGGRLVDRRSMGDYAEVDHRGDGALVRIFSFEDRLPSNYLANVTGSKNLSPGARIIPSIVLRDPYNCFSSYLVGRGALGPHANFDHAVRCWHEMAREVAGETRHVPGAVHLLYNEWVGGRDRRDGMAERLGFANMELGVDDVPDYGRGSSFDGMSKDSRGGEMDTGLRWLHGFRLPAFRSAVTEETHALSRRIFGVDLSGMASAQGFPALCSMGWFGRNRDPLVERIDEKNCLALCDRQRDWLEDSVWGQVEAQRIDPDAAMRSVPGWRDVFHDRFHDRGIVICAGGRYLAPAWILVSQIRALGCDLPIQIWHRNIDGGTEVPAAMARPFLEHQEGVSFVNASLIRPHIPFRGPLGGWELKPYAIANCRFREVLYLDADNIPLVDPSFLFDTPEFRETGALFWPDRGTYRKRKPIFDLVGAEWEPGIPEIESGQMVLDKVRCWKPLQFALWMNEHSGFFYKQFHGDKETFNFGWLKMGAPRFVHPPMRDLTGWDCICQHDSSGRRIFQHRSGKKYSLKGENPPIRGFEGHGRFLGFLERYRRLVEGGGRRG